MGWRRLSLETAGVATTVSAYVMKSVLASGLPGHMDNGIYTHVDTAVTYTIAGQVQYARPVSLCRRPR